MRTMARLFVFVVVLVLLAAGEPRILSQPQPGRSQVAAHYERATEAMRANRLDEAAQEFRAILSLSPHNAEAYADLGVIAFRQGKYAAAKEAFLHAVELKPQLWDAKAFLGMTELQLGDTDKGEELLSSIFPLIVDHRVKLDAGVALVRAYESGGTLERSLNIIGELQRAEPQSSEVQYLAYRVYTGMAAQALAILAKGGNQNGARMHQILAQMAVGQDDFPGAIKEYRIAIGLDSHVAGIHYELGRTILTNGQDEAALGDAQAEFEEELRFNPVDADAEYELGEVYRLRTDLMHAKQHYERALELRPTLSGAHLSLGEIYNTEGNRTEALAHYEAAVHLDSANEMAHYRLAQLYRAIGKSEEGRNEMNVFLKLKQERESAHPTPNAGKDERDIPLGAGTTRPKNP